MASHNAVVQMNDEDIQEYLCGSTQQELAVKLGVSIASIGRQLKALGICRTPSESHKIAADKGRKTQPIRIIDFTPADFDDYNSRELAKVELAKRKGVTLNVLQNVMRRTEGFTRV